MLQEYLELSHWRVSYPAGTANMPCERVGVLLLENLPCIIRIYTYTRDWTNFYLGLPNKITPGFGKYEENDITLLMDRPLHPPPVTQAFAKLYRTLGICILQLFLRCLEKFNLLT